MSMRQLARLDAKDGLHQQFVVALHLLRRLPADGAGHVVPRKEKAEGKRKAIPAIVWVGMERRQCL